jgi:hypothetical protein
MKIIHFIFTLLVSLHLTPAEASDSKACRQYVKTIVCLVDAPSQEPDRYKDSRKCLSGSSKYIAPVLETFDAYPPFVQEAVCGLKKIYIEKSFFGPAWSSLAIDSDPNSGLIGLRQSDIDAAIPAALYQSWFEQQSFGGKDDFHIDPDLPVVEIISPKTDALSGLTYSLLHEIGHIFDYQNKFNDETCLKGCTPGSVSWTTLSWLSIQDPKPNSDFGLRSSICLNNCNGKFISPTNADLLYKEIYQHGFISQLGSVNAMEDFAESFAFYVSATYLEKHFEIHTKSGSTYKLDDVLTSKSFESKLNFLKAHFSK